MRSSTMIARTYDGLPTQIIGNIEIELVISPQLFQATFQVMDIHPSYNMLLGSPWIHTARAITLSLHQRVKIIINKGPVIVKAKEALPVIRNGNSLY